MKALIRNNGETIRETDGIVGIDWTTGYPLTSPEWACGPYVLIQNYVEPVPDEVPGEFPVGVKEGDIITAVVPVAEVPKVYHINGKTYTEDELRAMLNQ